MRKLVTIRQVSAVNPIEGADAIECISIEGWKVVSQKGNYQVGDLAVYFEIDSFLPDGDERWQDLVDKSPREFEGKKGHRLRTIKLRGQVSQGFSIPLRKFPELEGIVQLAAMGCNSEEERLVKLRELDLSDVLGVVKWEPPLPAELAGLVKGLFPSFIRKTDQERVQNLPEVVLDNEAEYERTIKLDGSSMTVYHYNGEVGVCSRNLELKLEGNEGNTLIRVATESKLLKVLQELGLNIAVQGELMGPGIQGNREQFKVHQFYVFDIFNIDTQEYLAPQERRDLFFKIAQECNADLFKHVPLDNIAYKIAPGTTIEDLLFFAEGPSITHPVREGFVYKRKDGKFSFKTISNKFLLKEKD